MPAKQNKFESEVQVRERIDQFHSRTRTQNSNSSPDMPTVARMRQRLAELGTDDITMKQAVWIFGVSTKTPIVSRIERGELAAAKVMGEWLIDAASIHRYLDKVNKQFNRG